MQFSHWDLSELIRKRNDPRLPGRVPPCGEPAYKEMGKKTEGHLSSWDHGGEQGRLRITRQELHHAHQTSGPANGLQRVGTEKPWDSLGQ